MISYLSGLYCHNKSLEHTTCNAPYYSCVFSISLPQLAQWLVYSLLLTFTTAIRQVSFDMGCRPLKPLTLTSFARTNLISYKIQALFYT